MHQAPSVQRKIHKLKQAEYIRLIDAIRSVNLADFKTEKALAEYMTDRLQITITENTIYNALRTLKLAIPKPKRFSTTTALLILTRAVYGLCKHQNIAIPTELEELGKSLSDQGEKQ